MKLLSLFLTVVLIGLTQAISCPKCDGKGPYKLDLCDCARGTIKVSNIFGKKNADGTLDFSYYGIGYCCAPQCPDCGKDSSPTGVCGCNDQIPPTPAKRFKITVEADVSGYTYCCPPKRR